METLVNLLDEHLCIVNILLGPRTIVNGPATYRGVAGS